MTKKCPKCNTDNPDTVKFCGECGAQLPSIGDIEVTETMETPKEELTTGSTFADRYQIIEEVGKGGMGRVYRVLDKQLNEEIAIKLIKPDIGSDKNTIERFRNELKIARKIVQKNIGRMFDLNEDKGTYYITMEYVPGQDLKGLIRQSGQLAIGTTISLAKQICDGLVEAHKLGVVHRDLKPGNIMIDKEGTVRIMDFGIARSLEAKVITGAGVMIGTPEYMSPEQVEAKEVDQRSDIYSLGIIMYEMLTGRLPFEADTPFAVGVKHKSEKPKDPKEFNSQISDDLNRLILKCLEKDKENRYQGAGEVRSELEKIEQGLPTTDRVLPKRKTRTTKEITVQFTPKKLLIPVMVLAAVIITVLAIWQILPERERIKPTIAVISFENQTGDAANDNLSKIIPNLLITSLEQSGNFKVTTWERMYDVLEQMGRGDAVFIDRDLGFDFCRREEVDAIVLGSFAKAGDVFVTNLSVQDVQTKTFLDSASSKGQGVGSILASQVDDLSRQIAQGFGIPKKMIEEKQKKITEVTTASLEAYEYYLEGTELADRFLFEEAKKSLEKAVTLDPQFAMAHGLLGIIHSTQGNESARNEALKKAVELSERATERERNLINIFYFHYVEGDWERAVNIGKQATEKYPKDKRLHMWYGWSCVHIGFDDEAIKEFKLALQLDPNFKPVYNMLGYSYLYSRNFDLALDQFEKYAALSPTDPNPLDSMGDLLFTMGRLDESIASYKKAMAVHPDGFYSANWRLSYISAFREDYGQALEWVDRYIEQAPSPGFKEAGLVLKEFYHYWTGREDLALSSLPGIVKTAEKVGNEVWSANARWLLGWIFYDQGELEACREHFKNWFDFFTGHEPGRIFFYRIFYHFYLGLADLKAGNAEAARSRLDEIGSLIPKVEKENQKYFEDLLYLLLAEIQLAEGSFEEALTAWKDNPPILYLNSWSPFEVLSNNLPSLFDIHARIYEAMGEIDKAIAEYERLTTFDPESRDRRLIHPRYYYHLARLYEEKGWAGKAIDNYEKFLDLWKDADPGIAEVENARKRLGGLKD